jgi:hypothetical protein
MSRYKQLSPFHNLLAELANLVYHATTNQHIPILGTPTEYLNKPINNNPLDVVDIFLLLGHWQIFHGLQRAYA